MPHREPAPLQAMLSLLEQKAPRPLSLRDLARMLGAESYDRRTWSAALEQQAAQGRLRRIGKTRYQWVTKVEQKAKPARAAAPARERATGRGGGGRTPRQVSGVYSRVRAGFGFVEVEGAAARRFDRDVLIPEGMEHGAMHGDRVEVEVVRFDPRTHRASGEVVRVVERRNLKILGVIEQRAGHWWAIPPDELLPPVQIGEAEQLRRGDIGSLAIVEITRPPTRTRAALGHIERVLGQADDPEVQFLSIVFEHGLRYEFPPEVKDEAVRLPADPEPADYAGREDLRELPFVTIDGETARDFDDAVQLEQAAGGGFVLRVAIADVSHYVRPGSALDAEAARRGTSVYFPDRAIPMLPHELSTGLCSLNPQRDRLVLVAEMHCDRHGVRKNARFYRGVIRSHARLTYTRVAAVLSETDTPEVRAWRAELGPLLPQLHAMHRFMKILLERRIAAGSLDLDLPEALVDLSEEGRSIGVRLLQRNDAHRLIEELMLEANRAVATHLGERELPLPYRVHEAPEPDSIDELNDFLGAHNCAIQYSRDVTPRDVQRALDKLQAHPLARVFSRLVLRSLKQAHYTTENAGHFGLAFPIYCHFTSPIRRYPDLLVHRQLGRLLDGRVDEAQAAAEAVQAASEQSSRCERNAMGAERAMVDLKKAEFMLEHLLEPEPGTIVSVTKFGVFVELDAYPVEGLIHVERLPGARYEFDPGTHTLLNPRHRMRFRLGDRLLVQATNVSLRRREIDFELLKRLE